MAKQARPPGVVARTVSKQFGNEDPALLEVNGLVWMCSILIVIVIVSWGLAWSAPTQAFGYFTSAACLSLAVVLSTSYHLQIGINLLDVKNREKRTMYDLPYPLLEIFLKCRSGLKVSGLCTIAASFAAAGRGIVHIAAYRYCGKHPPAQYCYPLSPVNEYQIPGALELTTGVLWFIVGCISLALASMINPVRT
jgi:hypothetical protein